MRGWIWCRNKQLLELKHEEQVNIPGYIDYESSYRMKNLSFEIHHIVMSNLDMVTNILERNMQGYVNLSHPVFTTRILLLNLRWRFE